MAKTKKPKVEKVKDAEIDCETCVEDLEKRIDCNIQEAGLARFGVNRPYTVFVFIAVILIIGIFAFTTLRMELFPNMNIPFVVVISTYENGMTTREDALNDATRPMEQALLSVSGIREISSMSTPIMSVLIVELRSGVDIESMESRIARTLMPLGVQLDQAGFAPPFTLALNPNMMPVFGFSSTFVPAGLDASDANDLPAIEAWYQTNVILPLEQTLGVASLTTPFGPGAEYNFSYINGERAFSFSIQQQADAVTTATVAEILATLASVTMTGNNNFLDDFVTVTNDQGAFINETIGGVMNNLLLGAILCILVLFLFLRSPKLTLAVAISIPLSIVGTFVLMYFMGIGLNLVSMSGLALAVGMLVDNSVIVVENIYRLRNKGYSNRDAAIKGASQIFGAVIAATLTTVAVFFPMFFVQGLVMEVFMDMVWVIIFSLMASMVVAMMFLPSIIAAFKIGCKENAKEPWRITKWWRATPVSKGMTVTKTATNRWYNVALGWAIKFRLPAVGLAIVLFVGSIFLALGNGVVIIPPTDTGEFTVSIGLVPANTDPGLGPIFSHADRRLIAEQLIEGAGPLPGIQALAENFLGDDLAEFAITYNSGIGGGLMGMMMGGSGITLSVALNERRSMTTEEASSGLEVAIRQGAQAFGMYGTLVTSVTASAMETGMGDTGIVITLSGSDINELAVALNLIQVEIVGLDGIRRIDNNMSPMVINQVNQRFVGSLSIHLHAGYNMGQINNQVQDAVAQVRYDNPTEFADIQDVEDGFAAQMADTFPQMILALLVGLLLMYLVMVAIFRSFMLPFIILTVVPLAFTGGFLFLWIFGMPVSLVAMIGLLILMGVVTTNGIVLVDYINQSRRDGLNVKESIIAAANTRTRPILMTALSTILAMVPIAFATAGGGDMMQPLAIVTIGGLVFSTFMSLLIIPSFYAIFTKDIPWLWGKIKAGVTWPFRKLFGKEEIEAGATSASQTEELPLS